MLTGCVNYSFRYRPPTPRPQTGAVHNFLVSSLGDAVLALCLLLSGEAWNAQILQYWVQAGRSEEDMFVLRESIHK